MFTLVLLAICATTASALCYTPDGNISNDLSCSSSDSEASICCQRGYYCTKARLCLQPSSRNTSGYAFDGVYIRGTCSDETWQDPACGGNCVDRNPSGNENVQYCGSGRFCCGNDPACCSADSTAKILALGVPDVYATAGVYSSTVSTPSATSTVSELFDSQPTGQGRGQWRHRNERSQSKTVGIAVGVSLGIVLLAIILGTVLYMRRLRRDLVGRQEKTEGKVEDFDNEVKSPTKKEDEVMDSSDEEKWMEVRPKTRVELQARERFEMPG
ncbi:hypothetical protein K491DRAFT_744876 [Lophiostoma macrostomum CBS 122681]|uniref:Mid2 domain-containing protein n=1 Tax=Lophiostoma macrostomum CBS 122681 TaxID=1314788 RepID=A0A6A6TS42_9PLEO|nr:hypothetical protein K491DRAFT_744876 [Lophiostoma macrostomum CBS 122681]